MLGEKAQDLLTYEARGIARERLHVPGPDFVDRVYAHSDRNPRVLRSLQTMFDHGRLGGTGYLSILPVDQGVEHSGGASFAPKQDYVDPARIVERAIGGGCNAVASPFGVLELVARKCAHGIPFVVKITDNLLMTYPPAYEQ